MKGLEYRCPRYANRLGPTTRAATGAEKLNVTITQTKKACNAVAQASDKNRQLGCTRHLELYDLCLD